MPKTQEAQDRDAAASDMLDIQITMQEARALLELGTAAENAGLEVEKEFREPIRWVMQRVGQARTARMQQRQDVED